MMVRRLLAIAVLFCGVFTLVAGCEKQEGVVATPDAVEQYATPPGVAEEASKAAAEAAAAAARGG